MGRYRKLPAVILAALLLVSIAGCAQSNKPPAQEKPPEVKPLVAGADISYAPFEYKEGDKTTGFDVDLWAEIGKRLNRPTEFLNTAWDGLIPALQAKKFDVIMSDMGITKDRLKQVDFSVPYFFTKMGIVAAKDTAIKSVADLKGKTIGIQTGTIAEKLVRAHEKDWQYKKLVAYETMPDVIMDLEAGRIDCAANDRPFLSYVTKDKPHLQLLDLDLGDKPYPSGIAFRKEDTELRQQVNKALKEMFADGTYVNIYKKWFGREPGPGEMPTGEEMPESELP